MSLKNKKLKFNLQKFSESITDLTGYTWVGNSTIQYDSSFPTYNITYKAYYNNGADYDTGTNLYMQAPYDPEDAPMYALCGNGLDSFSGGFWSMAIYESYRSYSMTPTSLSGNTLEYIEFTGGTDVNSTSNNFASLLTWLQDNGTLTSPVQSEPISSFNSIKLNNNVLSFNGIKYQLDGTASITDNNNSSFKGISIVDNGDNTATLFVDSNRIIVNYSSSEK